MLYWYFLLIQELIMSAIYSFENRRNKPLMPSSTLDLLNYAEVTDSAYILITPALAKDILETLNTNNRPLSNGNVKTLVAQIQNEEWIAGTSTIIFSDNQTLLDGQHRLNAIVNSNTPLIFHVAFNMPEIAFCVLDTNKKRTGSDTLAKAGFSNLGTLNSMIRKSNHYYKAKGNMWNISSPCNNTKTLEIIKSNPHYQEIAKKIDANKDYAIYGNKSDLAACYAIFYKIDPILAEEFMLLLVDNYNTSYLGQNYDVLMASLKKELARNKPTKSATSKKTDPHEAESYTYLYMFDAFNAIRTKDNRQLKKMNRNTIVYIETHP